MNTFSYSPGESLFHRLDPRVKLFLLLLVSIVIFSVKNLFVVAVLLVLVMFTWTISKLPIKNLLGMFKILIPFFIFLILVQALWYPGKMILVQPLIPEVIPLIGGYGHITLDGIFHGVMIATRMAVLMSLIPILTSTSEVEDIVLGLVKVGLPYKYAYMATTAMNMVPTFLDETTAVKNAQLLRGCTVFEEGKFKEKILAYPALLIPLVIGAMRRAHSMGVAMDARSFGIRKTRTYIGELYWGNKDTIAIVVIVLMVVIMLVSNTIMNNMGIGIFETGGFL